MKLRAASPSDIEWIVARHAHLYAAEAGFDSTFGPAVRKALTGIFARFDRESGAGFVAEDAEGPGGSLFVTRDGDAARLRLFFLEPRLRRAGNGRAMLDHARAFARRAGYRLLVVSTYDRHEAACRLYVAAGFDEIERLPARAFGQTMIERRFEWVASAPVPD